MQPKLDDTLRELGRWVMEAAMLRQALGEEQAELARMATEVDSLQMQHKKLSATAIEQEKNLVALNERLMGKAAPKRVAETE